jgi:hypothetical protein
MCWRLGSLNITTTLYHIFRLLSIAHYLAKYSKKMLKAGFKPKRGELDANMKKILKEYWILKEYFLNI